MGRGVIHQPDSPNESTLMPGEPSYQRRLERRRLQREGKPIPPELVSRQQPTQQAGQSPEPQAPQPSQPADQPLSRQEAGSPNVPNDRLTDERLPTSLEIKVGTKVYLVTRHETLGVVIMDPDHELNRTQERCSLYIVQEKRQAIFL